jgi:hypothetical protein
MTTRGAQALSVCLHVLQEVTPETWNLSLVTYARGAHTLRRRGPIFARTGRNSVFDALPFSVQSWQETIAAGMAAVANRLRTARAASNSPFVRSWSDSVGRVDSIDLAAAPPALRCADAAVADPSWSTRLLTPRYAPLSTETFSYPSNGCPQP